MSIKDKLLEDMKEALRKQDKVRLGAIRMIRSAVKNKEIELGKELSDEEMLSVLTSLVKKHRDSIQQYRAGGRDDLVKKEEEELAVVQTYLPKPLEEKELSEMIEAAIEEVGADSKADLGKVMKLIMPKVKGRADGAVVNKMVRARLEEVESEA